MWLTRLYVMKNCCCPVYDLKTQITANQSHSAARPANILKLLTRQICAWDSWIVCNLLSHSSSFPLIEVDPYFLDLHIVFKSHLTDVSLPWPVNYPGLLPRRPGSRRLLLGGWSHCPVHHQVHSVMLKVENISLVLGMTWRQRLDLRGSCQERTL